MLPDFLPSLARRLLAASGLALALLATSAHAQAQGAPAAPPQTLAPDEGSPVDSLLAYADRVGQFNPADLSTEILNLGEPGQSPVRQMQLAIALSQTHLPVDTARALGLVQRVAASPLPESAPLKPLARLLSARLFEQRRLEDLLDRQTQQLRDSQRRIDQLNERLEAMRAIERSLNRSSNRQPTR